MGLLFALGSVVLVSAAQLLLKWAMIQLPDISQLPQFLSSLSQFPLPTAALFLGLLAYALSMLCWLLALKRLPLSRAYPLLSLSYLLVWLAALWLPGLNEVFRWGKLAGAGLIVSGLLLICWPAAKTR
ncbi:4-amino-4-deoxy-L-arabinose-phosphoundecaprenol flippase subunit ArnF [Erwinia tasmaniensis]|uniref:Probable 4-amino-4-deoxy-L-arabinose-phosphoundecaprenol flippase subunit ArnF n=1 Tax=Erwinia tasmaniensis (strain DSM 17950 / CFBP 7177 / CIP 109463 / NCPPB 4357 / Et1/99) TaxID=465817 RepID=ARNF_ERWT9|nr:4-amino-4-deoxy-L-arabinose-phosphoundecaprenol flippase subunit ArnF [Erwinia tasmaniensis]B2VBI5.1 RecName: Full=Probable 4-amino-4-deoxy-L-arabinose-phosphoundecaprenol flippase subunit ArnF; Short=L-Ara4N-phosphoundecaprenol flippase subunit ArnF; AltName: Full=Undecaprenyl phosphate-aminoarabinose flippase subunit ArnF [Erwinia tasmaniensis Et1/99]CAO97423.1 Putative transport/receptor protein [Erwinia tasmaniensis Et1/99]